MTELLTAAGLILTVLLAYLQIQRNHAGNIAAQEAHLRNELKLHLYERSASIFQEAARLVSKSASTVNSALSSLRIQLQGVPIRPIENTSDITNAQREVTQGISNVLNMLEQYEIVFARFGAIRRQLFDEHTRILDSHTQVFQKLVLFLPFEDLATGNTSGPLSHPTAQDITELEQLCKTYGDSANGILGFLIDLQIEAQNELLGALFGRQLPPRNPLDSTMKVLSRDRADQNSRPPGSLV